MARWRRYNARPSRQTRQSLRSKCAEYFAVAELNKRRHSLGLKEDNLSTLMIGSHTDEVRIWASIQGLVLCLDQFGGRNAHS